MLPTEIPQDISNLTMIFTMPDIPSFDEMEN
jgi:hypothetical protein